LREQSVDLKKVVERGLELAQPALSHLRVEVRSDSPEERPAIWGDPELLTQALLNLLANAAESLQESGGLVQIRLRREGTSVVVEVADDGPGIPRGDAEKVFEPFYTTKPKGSGLGLALASRIVDVHRGKLEVVPGAGAGAGGGGACFRLSLPLEPRPVEVVA
jgi:signal transduction histidine kinase